MIGRKFPKIKPAHWRLRKARAKYINFRQKVFDDLLIRPSVTFPVEIELEQSTVDSPRYLISAANEYIVIGIPYLIYDQSTALNTLYIYNEAETSTIIEDYE